MSISNPVDRAYSTMHAVVKGNKAFQSTEIQEIIGDIVKNITLKDTDTTDERIVKISTIIGTFAGTGGGIALAITVHPALLPVGIIGGHILGVAAGHGIVKVKHVVQDKCLIL